MTEREVFEANRLLKEYKHAQTMVAYLNGGNSAGLQVIVSPYAPLRDLNAIFSHDKNSLRDLNAIFNHDKNFIESVREDVLGTIQSYALDRVAALRDELHAIGVVVDPVPQSEVAQ